MKPNLYVCVSIIVALSGCSRQAEETDAARMEPTVGAVTTRRIVDADSEPHNWLSHGRTYDEQRYSPLRLITEHNVGDLGLDWYYDFPTRRGIEATPIVVDGLLFVTGSWSQVYAFNAVTGKLLWRHDPEVPREWAVHLCCDVVNRGVAVAAGKVLFGTLDGRLVALDAATGAVQWSVQTTDTRRPYSITGAPRIVGDKVIIGNGGAELGVRGYVSAYRIGDGRLLWRFYTVPGNPAEPFESPALEQAAKTWQGGEWWKIGGGGTVWDSMAFDPELNLLYIGVGNGSPWNRELRSPGGGDNLFLSSIVALDADSGDYVWHYQTTPGDSWDYTATQHMILADLTIDGRPRQVIMQAPKNGYFYVLDRRTGELLAADPYVPVSWSSHVDMASGRPVMTAGVFYRERPALAFPSPIGGHNWQPMSYSPDTGLVYIPAQEIPFVYAQDSSFQYKPGLWNLGINGLAASVPEDDPAAKKQLIAMVKGHISAWDPVRKKEVWRVSHGTPWNGGLLSTAGNLLFQGTARGEFVAYRASDGERLWASEAQTGVGAGPVTYAVGGEQYVAVAVGWGGAFALTSGEPAAYVKAKNRSRLLVYKLGGKAGLPPLPAEDIISLPEPPALTASMETLLQGKRIYMERCFVCHGDGVVSGGVIADLRYMSGRSHKLWDAIVRDGMLAKSGMVGFADYLSQLETDAVHAYVIKRSHDLVKELGSTR